MRITFSRTFVQSQLHAACLFSSEVSNCDQTIHERLTTLAMDQPVEAVNGRGWGPLDQPTGMRRNSIADRGSKDGAEESEQV